MRAFWVLGCLFGILTVSHSDENRFGDLWMEGFLTLQFAQNQEAKGLRENAVDSYLKSLNHYRSMRFYWDGHENASRLEERIWLIAQKVVSLGADPYVSATSVPDYTLISPHPLEIASTDSLPEIPSNWVRQSNGSIIVPLVETPETREYYRKIIPLLNSASTSSQLLFGK